MYDKKSPIGVMDSGVGGLTVVKAIEQLMPHEDVIFYGDSENCPYGNRDEATIQKFTENNIEFLKKHNIKTLAIACNTMSTLVDVVKKEFDFEIIGIIKPAAAYVVSLKPKDVGVVSTVFTAEMGKYPEYIHDLDQEINVIGQGSPSLAELIESGDFDYEAIDAEIKKEVGAIVAKDPHVKMVVLGCTHYPIVKDRFEKLFPGIEFINPAINQAALVKKGLIDKGLLNDQTTKGTLEIYTSGNTEKFAMMAKIIGLTVPKVIEFAEATPKK